MSNVNGALRSSIKKKLIKVMKEKVESIKLNKV